MDIRKDTTQTYDSFSTLRRYIRTLTNFGYQRTDRNVYTHVTGHTVYIVRLVKSPLPL